MPEVRYLGRPYVLAGTGGVVSEVSQSREKVATSGNNLI